MIEYPASYEYAKKLLEGRARKIANNTYLVERLHDKIAVRYHQTDVVTFSDRATYLDTGGWKTTTTRDRVRNCGIDLYVQDYEWFIKTRKGVFAWEEDRLYLEEDGRVFGGRGELKPLDASYRTSNRKCKLWILQEAK